MGSRGGSTPVVGVMAHKEPNPCSDGSIPSLPDLLKPAEVARVFGVSRSTAYRWMSTGVVPAIKVGSTVRTPAHLLSKLIEEKADERGRR